MIDLVVEGRLFLDGELKQGCVGIENGRIVAVKKVLRGETKIDAGYRIVLPAAMDPHVHFRQPGMTNKEDFGSGSLAALHGGVTTVLDMPNTLPPTDRLAALKDKKRIIRGRSYVDYGMFVTTDLPRRLEAMAPHAAGLKIFMGSTTGSLLDNDDKSIHRMLRKAEALNVPVSVHAEDDSMIFHEEAESLKHHLRNRPADAEFNAVRRLIALGAKGVNICHVTRAEVLDMAIEAGMSSEVAAHHMLLDIESPLGARGKVNPPLRQPLAKEALYHAVAHGKATMMGSDHAPHTADEKAEDFDICPSGVPGVETMFPLMMAAVKRNDIPLATLVRMACEEPARRFNVPKGRIEEGMVADLAIYDPRVISIIEGSRLYSKCGWTPYEGMEAIFPQTVIMHGEIQLKGGEPCGETIGRDIKDGPF